MSIIPSSTPKATRDLVLATLQKQWVKDRPDEPMPEFLVGAIRAYYSTTFAPAGNNRGVYDDAIFVIGKDTFAAFNANTDPSPFRHGVASLLPGCYPYKKGNHGISRPGGGYPAFRPATKREELPVRRDGEKQVPSARPGVAINIHRGGYNTTSSLGCQTLHPPQWDAFYGLVKLETNRRKLLQFWYVLAEGPIN
jgi:lysozyme